MDLSQIDMLRKGELAPGRNDIDDRTARGRSRLRVAQAGRAGVVHRRSRPAGQHHFRLRAAGVLAVVIFSGDVGTGSRAWLAGVAIAAIAVLGQALLSPPRIQEGHNVFLPGPALERGLPQDVYHHLAAAFDAQYPAGKRCDPKGFGCWQSNGFPDFAFAFSADGIWHASKYSRSVSALDFSDPVWLRLGFANELRYNWTGDTDVRRAQRDRRFWMGWDRWHFTMPWFEIISLPAAYVGVNCAGAAR